MKFKLIISVLIGFILFSCTEKFDINLIDGATNRLVVDGSFTSEYKIHQVKLSRTGEYFLNKPATRELNATVTITDGDTLINLVDLDTSGIYKTDKEIAGKPDHTYTLSIQLSNGEIYSASEFMKPIDQIDSIHYEYKKSDFPFDKKYYYNFNIFVQEPYSEGDYYQWELFFNNESQSDTLRLKTFVSDQLVNGSYIGNWTVYQVPDYKIKNDTTQARLQMLTISKEKYEYMMAILLETDYSGAGFSGPPANVPSNISNGALGYFSVSAVTEIETTIYKVKSRIKSTKSKQKSILIKSEMDEK